MSHCFSTVSNLSVAFDVVHNELLVNAIDGGQGIILESLFRVFWQARLVVASINFSVSKFHLRHHLFQIKKFIDF